VLTGLSRAVLPGAGLLAFINWPSCSTAQVLFDPSVGFITPGLNQPQPVLGTTDAFPPFATTGLGFAGAPASYAGPGFIGGVGPPQVGPATAPSRLTGQNPLLPPIVAGADPIQAGNNQAPWLIAQPSLTLMTGFDDNPRETAQRLPDSVTQFNPGLIVSADSPHLQGVLSTSLNYLNYVRATNENSLTADGAGYALATVSPDHLYLDARGAMVQVSPVGGAGFTNPQLGSFVEPETILTTSFTPVWRQSFGDLIETDLRYNYGTVSPIGSLSQSGPTPTSFASTQTNQGTLTAALGPGGGVLASRLILNAADISSASSAASTQVSGVTELQYRINPEVALIARGGYENLRYPNAGLAFAGPVVFMGTRLDLTPSSAISFGYGRDNGTWGFNGAVSQALSPRTLLLASYQTGISSQQQQILTNLNESQLDPYGTIVNGETGLPLALANPELSFDETGVFRIQQGQVAVEHEFETDSLRLFAFYEKETSLEVGVGSDIARGADISWFRTMTPTLTGGISVGYASHTGSKTLSAGLSLTLNLRTGVDAVLSYQFVDSITSAVTATTSPSFSRDILLAGIRASF
jgi:uncharacterized protein (PEP-CTERM system associated)